MAYWTLAQLKTKIDRELDLENETIVQAEEFVGYVNDAVRDVVAELIKVGPKDRYYHKYADMSIVSGTSEYVLPIDIYASKITSLVYQDQGVYPLKYIDGRHFYAQMQSVEKYDTSIRATGYTLFEFEPSIGYRIKLVPTPRETTSTKYRMYYIRQAQELSLTDNGSGLIDCPEEFIQFLVSFVKTKCLLKEIGNPMLQQAMSEEDKHRKLMIQTLTDQVQDQDNLISLDMTHYQESI